MGYSQNLPLPPEYTSLLHHYIMYMRHCHNLAPVAETGFSHRLSAYKIVGHFFGLSYRKITGSNQVKNSFFRISNIPVPYPHNQFRGRTVIKKLWTFFGPWGRGRSQSLPCVIFLVKRASQNLLFPPRIYPQPFSTMWLSQNPPLSPAWISVHALEGIAYISSLRTQCVQYIWY